MAGHLLGETFALLAALTWACALVLFKRSGERIPPLALNLFKNVVGMVLLLATLLAMGGGLDPIRHFPPTDFYILAISGVLGIALADTLLFHSLNLLGVGLLSIVDCLYSPFVIACSFLMLSEDLSASHYLGGALVIFGVLISSRHPPPPNRTRAQILVGILLAILALAAMAVGIVMAKPVLDVNRFPLIWATTLRLIPGTIVLALLALASSSRKQLWSVFRPSPVWKFSLPGSILGTYMAMVFWIGGFKYAKASIAAILNQTTVIFALILAAAFLKEPFTRRKLIAVVLSVIGTAVVTLDPF